MSAPPRNPIAPSRYPASSSKAALCSIVEVLNTAVAVRESFPVISRKNYSPTLSSSSSESSRRSSRSEASRNSALSKLHVPTAPVAVRFVAPFPSFPAPFPLPLSSPSHAAFQAALWVGSSCCEAVRAELKEAATSCKDDRRSPRGCAVVVVVADSMVSIIWTPPSFRNPRRGPRGPGTAATRPLGSPLDDFQRNDTTGLSESGLGMGLRVAGELLEGGLSLSPPSEGLRGAAKDVDGLEGEGLGWERFSGERVQVPQPLGDPISAPEWLVCSASS